MNRWSVLVLWVVLGIAVSSCKAINSNRVLFYEKGTLIRLDSIKPMNGYAPIVSGDVLNISIHPNKGEQILIGKNEEKNSFDLMKQRYLVDLKGEVDFPLLGKIPVQGKTVHELKKALEDALSKVILEPFVVVSIENERVILFSGKGEGKVIPLNHPNTNLLEIIAQGGSLKENSKSQEVHLIRKVNNQSKTYRFDISSIQNLTAAEIHVLNHDIIVVNYYPRKLQSGLKEINPWLNIATAGLALVSIILRFTP